MVEREINLNAVMIVMWERGKRIAFYTLICMIVAAVATLFIPKRYRSEVNLFMTKSKIGERAMEFPSVSIDTYEKLFYRELMLKNIIDKFQLKEKPYRLKYPKDLRKRIDVDTEKGTSLISVYVELEDPQMCADVANEIALQAQLTNQNLIDLEAESSRDKIREGAEPILESMNVLRNTYLEIMQKNKKQVVMSDFNTNTSILATHRQEKENLDVSITELEDRAKYFAAVFSATDFEPTILLDRRVIYDPLTKEILDESVGEMSLENLASLSLSEEHVNTNYYALQLEYKKLMIDLPAMKAKRSFLIHRIEALENLVDQQSQILADMDVEEMVAKADFDRALEIFGGIDKEVGWAPTTVVSERQDLYIVDSAFPNPKKVYPMRSLIVGAVGMISFLILFMYYLLLDLYGLVELGTQKKT